MVIKIPCGKRCNILNINGRKVRYILEDAVKNGINGYLRVTTEGEGLEDYYIFVHEVEVAGAYAELHEGSVLSGPEALEKAVEVTDGVVDLCILNQDTIRELLLAFPNLRVKGPGHGAGGVGGFGGYDSGPRREALLKKYNLKEPGEEFADSVVKDYLGA